jgi:hypothetical protein
LPTPQEIDELRARDDPLGALALLEKIKDRVPEARRCEVVWRQARGAFDRSERDAEAKQGLLQQARRLAEAAVALDADNSDAHKWLAISAGNVYFSGGGG